MRKCVYEKKYRDGLTRCTRDGSLRYCDGRKKHRRKCPFFKMTLWQRFLRWWNS